MKKFCILLIIGVSALCATTVSAQSDVLEKQREIDAYIFEENSEELAKKGITVTHTGPLEDEGLVEIGITPFTEDHANYLYELFGADQVKVVEGQMATTLATGPAPEPVGEEIDNSYWAYVIAALVAIISIFGAIRFGKRIKA